jgi:alpha-ketoglutarate-dependent taurine dioxygenase
MKTQPIEFPGIDYVLENQELFKKKFISDSVLVFRNANLSFEEQYYFHKALGQAWGWFVKDIDKVSYTENHDHNRKINEAKSDEVMLDWHIEHVYYDNPTCAGSWNMYLFNTDSKNGKTYFVDTSKIYNKLPDDWKTFLNKSKVDASVFNQDVVEYDAIKKHWLTEENVIRIHFARNNESLSLLKTFDNRVATEEENKKFIEICSFINNEVWNNEDIRIVHMWQKGDLVIPDVFRLAHSVTGGFNPKDREFTGMWGHQKPI